MPKTIKCVFKWWGNLCSLFKVSHVTMLLDCAVMLYPLDHHKNRNKTFAVVTHQSSALSGRFADNPFTVVFCLWYFLSISILIKPSAGVGS